VIRIDSPFAPLAQLAGARIVVLNWRDVQHPQAGGAEQYMHQIATRWVGVGARVTWLTARGPGQSARAVIDGIEVVRAGGALSLYPRAASALLRRFGRIDYVVDCQNGIPFFSPLFVERDVPVVQVVHHVHQDQFGMRFGPVLAAVGRFLEGKGTRVVYKDRPTAAVSPSTRQELRRRLGFRGPIHIVPNGGSATPEVRSPRDPSRRSRRSRGWSRTSASTCSWPSWQSPHRWYRSCGWTSSVTAPSGSGSRRWRPSWGSATSSPSTASSPTRSVTSWCAAPG
jgi:hypothetical protein